MQSHRHVNYFYTNYVRNFMNCDHTHARVVLNAIHDDFGNGSLIKEKIKNIQTCDDSDKGKMNAEVSEVSHLISKEIPIYMKLSIHIDEYLISKRIIDSTTPFAKKINNIWE